MKTKKLLSLLLAIIMVVSMMATLGISASAKPATDQFIKVGETQVIRAEGIYSSEATDGNYYYISVAEVSTPSVPKNNISVESVDQDGNDMVITIKGVAVTDEDETVDILAKVYSEDESDWVDVAIQCGYHVVPAEDAEYLDLDENTTEILDSKDLDQNYNLTVNEGAKNDVTKVKLSWEIKDINATRTDNKVWDTENLCWKTDSSSTTINQQGSAKFTLENYSSEKVNAIVTFDTAEYATGKKFTAPTLVFDEDKNENTTDDGVITLDTANGNNTYSKTNPPKGKIDVTVTPDADDFKSLSATSSAAKYGTYTVTIHKTVSSSVGKVTPTVVAPVGNVVDYNFQEQALITLGSTNGGTLKYALGDNPLNDSAYSAAIPTAQAPGEYTIWYKVFGDDNYESTFPESVDAIISKLGVEIEFPTANELSYTGEEQELITVGTTSVGTMKYAVSEEEPGDEAYSASLPTAAEEGTYTVWYKVFGDDVYEYPEADFVTVTIGIEECFAAGTKITMADGSLKNIEDITVGEKVLSFNHETGKYEAQEVYIAYVGEGKDTGTELIFSDGTTLTIVGEHDLFEKESMKYVTLTRANAKANIGKHYYNAETGKFVKLKSVKATEPVNYYSLYTKYNYNCIANGMLSVPDDVDVFLNIYQFNDDLSANEAQLQKDIATYGIYEYRSDAPYSKAEYDMLKIKYVNILVGKGLASNNEIDGAREEYLELR